MKNILTIIVMFLLGCVLQTTMFPAVFSRIAQIMGSESSVPITVDFFQIGRVPLCRNLELNGACRIVSLERQAASL